MHFSHGNTMYVTLLSYSFRQRCSLGLERLEAISRCLDFLPRCIHAGRSFLRQRCLSVRMSVFPSHAWIVAKRTIVPPRFLYHMKGKFTELFGHIERLVGDAPFYLKFWVKLTHPASKTAIFTRYLLVAKKVQLWLIGAQYKSFPIRWTAYVALKAPRGLKGDNFVVSV